MEFPTTGTRFVSRHEVTDGRVRAFGEASGDHNPLHFDDDYAERTRFQGRIAHGMLTASFVSAAIADAFGSDSQVVIYVDQRLRFMRPVRLGDVITVVLEVLEANSERHQLRLATSCSNQADKVVMDGEATIMLEAIPVVPAELKKAA